MSQRRSPSHLALIGLGAILLAGLSAEPLSAQRGRGRPVQVFGRQDLDFGILLPGVPTTITRRDAANAGQFELRGRAIAEVRINLLLPANLVSPLGRQVVLQFRAGDGGWSRTANINAATAFDPRVPLVIRFGLTGRLYIYLGGTALPTPTQGIGIYTATITLSVAYTGN